MFNVNVSLIRFWEKEFSILKPKKNKKGNRMFTQKDIENLKMIGLKPTKKIKIFNGKLECRFLKFDIYEGSKKLKKIVSFSS